MHDRKDINVILINLIQNAEGELFYEVAANTSPQERPALRRCGDHHKGFVDFAEKAPANVWAARLIYSLRFGL